jgi:hypothetical protein
LGREQAPAVALLDPAPQALLEEDRHDDGEQTEAEQVPGAVVAEELVQRPQSGWVDGVILRRLCTALVCVVLGSILLAGAAWVYDRFLAPEHGVVMRTRAINAAHQAVLHSNHSEALNAIEKGKHDVGYEDWELLTWQAVLLGDNKGSKRRKIGSAAVKCARHIAQRLARIEQVARL